MYPIVGYFLFTNLGNGSLGARYGNTRNVKLFAECAVRVSGNKVSDPFLGTYASAWLNSAAVTPGESVGPRLVITFKQGASGGLYCLIWYNTEKLNIIQYYGEGMLSGNDLVGAYWSPDVKKMLGI